MKVPPKVNELLQKAPAAGMESESSGMLDLGRLHAISTRLAKVFETDHLLHELLKAIMELQGADFGLLQLCEEDEKGPFLKLKASVGHSKDFLLRVARIEPGQAACGQCLKERRRVIIEDTQTHPFFAPYREMAKESGFRSVQSTPLITRAGEMIGVLSTHFRQPHHSSEKELRLTDLYIRQVVDCVEISQLYQKAQKEAERRRRTEETLMAREMHFVKVLEKLPAGAYLCDAEGLITYFNQQAVDVWGRVPALNHPADRFCGSFKLYSATDGQPLDHAECWMALALRHKKDYLRQEIMIERPDGTRITGMAHASPYFNEEGKLLGAVNVLVDVTHLKEIEKKNQQLLKEVTRRSDQLSALARASQEINRELDIPHIMQRLVESAVAITGASAGCAGFLEQERMVFREYYRDGHFQPINLSFGRDDKWGIPSWVMRHQVPYICNDATQDVFLRPDLRDQYGITNFVNVPVFDRQGGLIACLQLHNKPHGPFLEQHLIGLQGLASVAATALENAQLFAKVREADQRKDEFLAILAHELRNPLAPIRTALHIMQSPQSTKEIRFSARDMMERQVEHMVRLVDDLLDVARITRGKIELKTAPVTLSEVIHQAVETSRPIVEELRHQLVVDIPSFPIHMEADLLRLSQVFSNLIHNAAKYTNPGGTILVRARLEHGQLQVQVVDTGIGMSAETLSRVFDMFVQGNTSLERAQGGLGIGLTLVRTLVEMHGGTVYASSEGSGKGSTFTVYLPATGEVQEQAEDDPQEEDKKDPSGKPPLKVLVVDDNQASAQTLAWAMELLGHDVRLATEGREAIAIGKEFLPHVVLLDIGLPGMNGYEVCQEMRKDPALQRTIFVAQTGWGQEQYRKLSKDAGFSHHLVKPVSLDTLEELLSSIQPS